MGMMSTGLIGLIGILAGLGVLITLSCRSWSLLPVGSAAAPVAAANAGAFLLASWAQVVAGGAAADR